MISRYKMRLNKYVMVISLFILIFAASIGESAKDRAEFRTWKMKAFKPVVEKLLKNGADTNFVIRLVNSPKTRFNEKFVRINVNNHLRKLDYSSNYSSYSVKKAQRFIQQNNSILNLCETKYDIPKEVITSVIWVETRFGNILGKNHVPSVYLSTAMANEAEYVERNKDRIRKSFEGDSTELKELLAEIESRSDSKANWAIEELLALEKMDSLSSISIDDIEGSWAGAFGISQFLPSSYVKWAVDGTGDGKINLFDLEDAVFSAANYLKTNGWGETTKERRAAIYHYNNSWEYVNAILMLCHKLNSEEFANPFEDNDD